MAVVLRPQHGAGGGGGKSAALPPPELVVKEIPEQLYDPGTKRRYQRGRFLGKGGFAKCYEMTDVATGEVFAGKIVSKTVLMKPHQKEKMSMEITIHRSLGHANVVNFHSFFEDDDFVYVILELCRRRSLMELHKRRKALSEPEARYFLRHVILGCQYLHINKVIHRDLKLGNLFLNDDMEVKIGDFGLATRIEYEGERKKTLCGTPNYIAPEVLIKKGHSYEVDIWSIGCIMYTLLVGKPPFETSSLKDTYARIKRTEYTIPKAVSATATTLIARMLRSEPLLRPSIAELLQDEFFTSGYLPARLPTTCLSMAPRFSLAPQQLPPAVSAISAISGGGGGGVGVAGTAAMHRKPLLEINKDSGAPRKAEEKKEVLPGPSDVAADVVGSSDYYLTDLFSQLSCLLEAKPSERLLVREDEAEDPAAVPVLWVSKWVDYSDKYGLGYTLCDNSVGVLFNDSTRMLLYPDGEQIQYIERDLTESFFSMHSYPTALTKKVTLTKYFHSYMSEHLLKAGANIPTREGDELARLPYLRTWFRTRSAIVLHLSNGTLQINFFKDHAKIMLCPLMGAVTYIDEKRNARTLRLALLAEHGCSADLMSRLRYARSMAEKMLSSRSGSVRGKIAAP
ncbi:serine/threonine-protein kinase PLK1 isoform X2 [Petromyzon marinus]|uniref:Serine/threonine-protein kinase PLK n=1 Tax=Petromyzon marinus TaxID=7757 RepID=A0AAJ7XF69_PETMA|nr:serine/threonine-protein kinase PLK1 isoform X2 [Petromyzon marinus]